MTHQVEPKGIGRLSRPGVRLWFGGLHQWVSVVLAFLVLAIAVWSIEQAEWITPQPSLTLILGIAVLSSLLLTKSRLPAIATHGLMLVLGAVITIWQLSVLLGSQSWWQAIAVRPSESTSYFAIFLIVVTWIIGHSSTWFILRRQNAWIAVFLGTITILVNLSNLTEEHYYLFPIYLIAALLLIGQMSLARQHDWIKKYGIKYPKRGLVYLAGLVIFLSTLTVSGVWFTPEIKVSQLWSTTSANTSQENSLEQHWLNFFAAVPSKWRTIRSGEQEILFFGETANDSSEILFVITSEQSHYWRNRRYDTYNSWGWTSITATDQMLSPETAVSEGEMPDYRRELTYTVENKLRTDVLLTAGEFVSSDIPVLLQTLEEKGLSASLTPSSSGQALSAEGRYLAVAMNPATILPVKQPALTEAALAQGETIDIIAVTTPELLKPYQRYTITASITTATPAELSQAGENYTQWVTDYYLQLPNTLPWRVRQFSQRLTEEAETAYDKAIAIKGFLVQFEYTLETKVPPQGVDGVDYFIFNQQEGDCTEFASAMVVMLRAAGVPARLSTGYLRGELDKESGNFLIRSRDAHAWAEVYFPGYGWVIFDATPSAEDEAEDEEDVLFAGDGISGIDEFLDVLLLEQLYGPFRDGSSSGMSSALSPEPNTIWAIIGVPSLVMLALALVVYRWLRRLTRAEQASDVYAKMCSLASWIKAGPNPQETPFEYGNRLALVLPVQAEAIGAITQVYAESQFSQRKEVGKLQKGRLGQSWHDVYRALLKRVLRLGR